MRPRKGASLLPATWLLAKILVASLVVLQIGSPLAERLCVSECAEDDTDGRCTPVCEHCACCARTPLLASAAHAALRSDAPAGPVVIGELRLPHAGIDGRVFRPPRAVSSRDRS